MKSLYLPVIAACFLFYSSQKQNEADKANAFDLSQNSSSVAATSAVDLPPVQTVLLDNPTPVQVRIPQPD
jgi:hypothetical protein